MKPVGELLKNREGMLWHVRPDDTVYQALQLLSEYEVGALMVMDRGKVVGVLSERDYTRKVILKGRSSKEALVEEIMTRDVVAASPDITVAEGMRINTQPVGNTAEQVTRPDVIWLFRRPILDEWAERGDVSIQDLVGHVVVHELAHHFGWTDEQIAAIDRWWE